jgi:hypothetical protein
MKTIDIAGIPFTEEVLLSLKEWMTPNTLANKPLILCDAELLDNVQSYLITHWDELSPDNEEIKGLLKGIQYVKKRLAGLYLPYLNSEGGEP